MAEIPTKATVSDLGVPAAILGAKRKGELVEVAFMHKAVELGFAVAKPYGDSELYDFILDTRNEVSHVLWRVQVKSTATMYKGAYHIIAAHSRKAKQLYTPGEIDFLVAYVVPVRAWYVLPCIAFPNRRYLSFFPHIPNSRGRYEKYRDAWKLMLEPSP
jgi:hypothetical protein